MFCMGGIDGRVVQLKLDIGRAEAMAQISELIMLAEPAMLVRYGSILAQSQAARPSLIGGIHRLGLHLRHCSRG